MSWEPVSSGLPDLSLGQYPHVKMAWASGPPRLFLGVVDSAAVWMLVEEIAGTPTGDSGAALLRSRLSVTPNPSTGAVRLSLDGGGSSRGPRDFRGRPEGGVNDVMIMDAAGRRIRELRPLTSSGGRDFGWDGRDDHGHEVKAGCYLAVISGAASAKIFVVR